MREVTILELSPSSDLLIIAAAFTVAVRMGIGEGKGQARRQAETAEVRAHVQPIARRRLAIDIEIQIVSARHPLGKRARADFRCT